MKKTYTKKRNNRYFFKLSVLSKKSNNIYKSTVAQFINNTSLTIEKRRAIMFKELGQVAINSQFAEKQFFRYAFLFDAFKNQEQAEVISKLQDSINEIDKTIKTFIDTEEPYTQLRKALKDFSKLIPEKKSYIDLANHSIDNRNYLIHHCIIENPMLLYVEDEIIELTKKVIYCNALLIQIIYDAEKYFNEIISVKFPEISSKYQEFTKSVNKSMSDML